MCESWGNRKCSLINSPLSHSSFDATSMTSILFHAFCEITRDSFFVFVAVVAFHSQFSNAWIPSIISDIKPALLLPTVGRERNRGDVRDGVKRNPRTTAEPAFCIGTRVEREYRKRKDALQPSSISSQTTPHSSSTSALLQSAAPLEIVFPRCCESVTGDLRWMKTLAEGLHMHSNPSRGDFGAAARSASGPAAFDGAGLPAGKAAERSSQLEAPPAVLFSAYYKCPFCVPASRLLLPHWRDRLLADLPEPYASVYRASSTSTHDRVRGSQFGFNSSLIGGRTARNLAAVRSMQARAVEEEDGADTEYNERGAKGSASGSGERGTVSGKGGGGSGGKFPPGGPRDVFSTVLQAGGVRLIDELPFLPSVREVKMRRTRSLLISVSVNLWLLQYH